MIQLENSLPCIPEKRYFTISEVSKLCAVKPHVLRYWEQEFAQLRPMKRRGNRRYYQLHEVKLIRQIRQLLYEQGFTIVGARNKLQALVLVASEEILECDQSSSPSKLLVEKNTGSCLSSVPGISNDSNTGSNSTILNAVALDSAVERPILEMLRHELISIRNMLGPVG